MISYRQPIEILQQFCQIYAEAIEGFPIWVEIRESGKDEG